MCAHDFTIKGLLIFPSHKTDFSRNQFGFANCWWRRIVTRFCRRRNVASYHPRSASKTRLSVSVMSWLRVPVRKCTLMKQSRRSEFRQVTVVSMVLCECCQLQEANDSYKGSQQIHTQTGEEIMLTSIEYDSDLCKEFIMNYKPFSFKRWLMWTIIFNSIGYLLNLHTQDSQLMTVLLAIVFVTLLLKLNIKVKQESLLVSSGVGVQLTTSYVSGRTKSHFYDITEIQDIIINEGITLHQAIFYLTLVLQDMKNGKKLVPVFSHCWPCLDCLQKIYRDVQKVLHQKKQI